MNILLGVISLILAFLVIIRRKPFKNILLSKMFGFDMYFMPMSNKLRFLIVVPLFFIGLYFLWKENMWYLLGAIIAWVLLNFLVAAKNSDGAKATKIFNIYKRIKSLGGSNDEKTVVLQTARAYYKMQGFSNDLIELKTFELPMNITDSILKFVEYILISEGNLDSGFSSYEETSKRQKIIETSYYTVFKEKISWFI